MQYYSTRNHAALFSLQEAAFRGLAPDGGLFMPAVIPHADLEKVRELSECSFSELSRYLTGLFFGDELPEARTDAIAAEACRFPVPLKQVGKDKYTLELFHGPTFAFKDIGAGFMGHALRALNRTAEETIILTATSGDTGSAVANGFDGIEGVKVVILYPDGQVSDLQESQMATLGRNIFPLKVKGTFDDCQRIVKDIFSDADFRREKRVTSANSINILRWIPQSFYYFHGWAQWVKATGGKRPGIVVPSGNYGNLAAGLLAAKMGLPVRRFIAAANANDTVPKYLRSGRFEPQPSVRTVANAMDVGNPSNFERIVDLFGNDFSAVTARIGGYSCDDQTILEAIRELYDRYGYLSDPHSAVGYKAACEFGIEGFWLSTAHGAKFGEVIRTALGKEFPLPSGLHELPGKEKLFTRIGPSTSSVENFIRSL